MPNVATGHTAFILANAGTQNLGRLTRGCLMESKSGHRCVYRAAPGGYWTCGHNFVISATDNAAARLRAQEPGQVSADGTGRSVDAAPTPASEMPACPTTAPLAAGGLFEALARAS